MSLVVKSRESTSGFSTMTADELLFINGGSGNSVSAQSLGITGFKTTPSSGFSVSGSGISYTKGNVTTTLSGKVNLNSTGISIDKVTLSVKIRL